MRVLITGGSGFIGTRLVRRLLQASHEVTVFDLEAPRVEGVNFIRGNVTDPATVEAAFDTHPESVVHLAAKTSVLNSIKVPKEVFETNVLATQLLLDQARLRGTRSFVFASTNAVVGQSDSKISERTPTLPLTPYGASKAASEALLSAYSSSYGIVTSALRLTNVYGPEMWRKDSIIPRLFRFASGQGTFSVYGDGEQYRDYVFVDDVAAAMERAMESNQSTVVPIGSGESISVTKLVQLVSLVTECQLAPESLPAQPGEMRGVEIDITGAEKWGYSASVMITEGLNLTWQDFQTQLVRD